MHHRFYWKWDFIRSSLYDSGRVWYARPPLAGYSWPQYPTNTIVDVAHTQPGVFRWYFQESHIIIGCSGGRQSFKLELCYSQHTPDLHSGFTNTTEHTPTDITRANIYWYIWRYGARYWIKSTHVGANRTWRFLPHSCCWRGRQSVWRRLPWWSYDHADAHCGAKASAEPTVVW